MTQHPKLTLYHQIILQVPPMQQQAYYLLRICSNPLFKGCHKALKEILGGVVCQFTLIIKEFCSSSNVSFRLRHGRNVNKGE